MKTKRWIAGLLSGAMAVSLLLPGALAADTGATRGQVCDMLLAAANNYNPGVAKTDILKGEGDGDLQESRVVTRAEALVMLQRAFGTLPKPVGGNARSAFPASSFTDVPAWAQTELASVFDAGIVAGTSGTTFSPNDPVTAAQMQLFIQRTYALFGTNKKDDLYAAVNKDFIENAVIKPGRQTSGTLYDLMDDSNADVQAIIEEVAGSNKSYANGTKEQKISDLYHNIINWDARDKAGITPIKPYLDAIDSATSLSDLMAVQQKLSDETKTNLFLSFALTTDAKDSSKYMLYLYSPSATLTKEMYAAGGAQTEVYLAYLKTLYQLGGLTEAEAARDAELYYNMEATLSAASYAPQEYVDISKIYNIYSMQELRDLLPNIDVDAVFAQSGLKAEDRVMVRDPGLLKAYAAMLEDAQLDTLKAAGRIFVLSGFASTLSRDFTDAANKFNQAFYGIEGTVTDEELASQYVQSIMPDYLGKLYVDKHFSAKAKADVTAMVDDFLAIYRERIQKLDWMSESTKQKALRKLDTLGVKIGYPDSWDTYLDQVTIKSAANGGSFYENMIALTRAQNAELISLQGKPVDKSQWVMSAYTVNAMYNPTSNDITFPAGILQAPMYDVNASREQNLGAIGYIIAHEMTHAFDNNGSKFDENGNANDWWTQEDYAAFQKLCDEVVAYYDGQEGAPGIVCNGTLTLSENIADLGAAACVTEAAKKLDNPDFKLLYETMTKTWASTSSRETMAYLAQIDVHAPDKLRGNRVVQSCDEFYTAFDIQPTDGMYLAPEARARIW